MIIAIDGPAASGKGTIARQIAAVYGLPHLDTGLIYRAVAKAVLDAGRPPDDAEAAIAAAVALDPAAFDEESLKAQPITEAASVVAAIPDVREALMDYQRQFATRAGRGARRPRHRYGYCARCRRQTFRGGEPGSPRQTPRARIAGAGGGGGRGGSPCRSPAARRARFPRTAAPLKAAPDAHLLDTTHLSIDAAFRAAVESSRPFERAESAANRAFVVGGKPVPVSHVRPGQALSRSYGLGPTRRHGRRLPRVRDHFHSWGSECSWLK